MSGNKMKPSASAAAPFNSHRPSGMGRDGLAIAAVPLCVTADAMALVQSVLMELAALHDRAEMFALLLEQAEVLQRVAIDHDEVGIGAGFQRADFPFHAYDTRAGRGRGADDFDRAQHLAANRELAALLD